MPNMHHIAILHDVFLAFQSQRALGASRGFRPRFQQLIPTNGLGAERGWSIRQLEDELGFPLLYRMKGSVELTDAGKVFLVQAKHILAQVQKA